MKNLGLKVGLKAEKISETTAKIRLHLSPIFQMGPGRHLKLADSTIVSEKAGKYILRASLIPLERTLEILNIKNVSGICEDLTDQGYVGVYVAQKKPLTSEVFLVHKSCIAF